MTFKLNSVLDMNDIKKEDAIRYDTNGSGSVKGIAIIVDGATGFQKDMDAKGNIIKLPDITRGEFSSARIWADKLSDALLKNAKDENKDMIDVLQTSIEDASKAMPMTDEKFEHFQTPSACVMTAREKDNIFEVIGCGDCCLIMEYNTGEIDCIVGNPILEKRRADRSIRIREENPGFDDLGMDEKAKIQFKYMKQTRMDLGNFEQGYFVPFYNGTEKMNAFLGDEVPLKENSSRTISNIKRGDIWVVKADIKAVKSFMISSDGFIEKLLKNKLANEKEILEIGKNQAKLQDLANKLRALETGSNAELETVTMKITHGSKNTGSADDMTALCFDIVG